MKDERNEIELLRLFAKHAIEDSGKDHDVTFTLVVPTETLPEKFRKSGPTSLAELIMGEIKQGVDTVLQVRCKVTPEVFIETLNLVLKHKETEHELDMAAYLATYLLKKNK